MLVPDVNLNLILAEEQINLVVAEDGAALAPILPNTDLAAVDRMVLGGTDMSDGSEETETLASLLGAAGFEAECAGAVTMFSREKSGWGQPEYRAASR